MIHEYKVKARLEEDLTIYTTALSRFCADSDFESWLRGVWKHRELGEEAEVLVNEIWDQWHETRADIGEVQ